MTELATEKVVELTSLEDLDFDIELPCEVAARRQVAQGGMPECLGEPAAWVGWRANCCPTSPRYLLLCDRCATTYRNWIARGAAITCADCGTETGGFLRIEPLNRRA